MDLTANHDTEIYTVSAVFLFLTVVAVLLRLYSARLRKSSLAIDDIFVIAALIVTLGEAIIICIGTRVWGVGRHHAALTPKQVENNLKLAYVVTLLQPTAIALAKAAVLALYYRIFTTRGFRIAIYVNGIVIVLWWISLTLVDALICLPARNIWRKGQHCNGTRVPLIIGSTIWILTDVIILFMPVPSVWGLHLPQKQRIALVGVFLLGGFACISSAVRFSTSFYPDEDTSWTATDLSVWSIIESCVTIISACLIVMKPVFIRFFPPKACSKNHKKFQQIDSNQRKDVPPMIDGPAHMKDWTIVGLGATKGSLINGDDTEWNRSSSEEGEVPLCKIDSHKTGNV